MNDARAFPSLSGRGQGEGETAGDEHVQYAGVFARRVEGFWKEEARFVWQARIGNWVYQEDFISNQ